MKRSNKMTKSLYLKWCTVTTLENSDIVVTSWRLSFHLSSRKLTHTRPATPFNKHIHFRSTKMIISCNSLPKLISKIFLDFLKQDSFLTTAGIK